MTTRYLPIYSQVSVGGLLALDQIFGETLVNFGPLSDFDMLVKEGALDGAEITDLTNFEGYVDLVKGPLGFL
jgi:hypothetical protein